MKALLDTHAFLWAIGNTAKLSDTARRIIRDEANTLLVSAASLWQIALKVRAGKLKLPEQREYFIEHMSLLKAQPLAVEAVHVLSVFSLPDHHRDPFDRILVAQCITEGIPIVTGDAAICEYAVQVIW